MRSWGLAVALFAVWLPHPLDAQQYINGLFIRVKDGGVTELIAYAEPRANGVFRMQQGELEDAPVVHELEDVFSGIPLWRPTRVLVTTARIFRDDQAEWRQLPFAGRAMNVYSVAIRIVDLQRREKIDALLKSVRASFDEPGYAFIVLSSSNSSDRFYPIRLTPEER